MVRLLGKTPNSLTCSPTRDREQISKGEKISRYHENIKTTDPYIVGEYGFLSCDIKEVGNWSAKNEEEISPVPRNGVAR